jgi:hypothetical protein
MLQLVKILNMNQLAVKFCHSIELKVCPNAQLAAATIFYNSLESSHKPSFKVNPQARLELVQTKFFGLINTI